MTAGYRAPSLAGEASAGDAVEIVSVQRGSRSRDAGLWVRASSRFVEAARQAGRKRWDRISAADWLGGGAQ